MNSREIKSKYPRPIGMEFYTFITRESDRGTSLYIDTSVIKIKIIARAAEWKTADFDYEVIMSPDTKTTESKRRRYNEKINSTYTYSVDEVFETYEEAALAYDTVVKAIIKKPKCNAKELKALNKKLIYKFTPLEEAEIWFENLDPRFRTYLELLGHIK